MMILFLVLLPTACFAAEFGTARISLIKGDVQIYTDDTQEWVAASINMPLREGDRIWVPEGARTELQIQGGVYIRLDSATSFDILALQEDSFQFYMDGGGGYVNNRKGGIDHIQIDTPQSSIGCYDNSLVMIDVAQSGATDVSIVKGYALAETREGKSRVEAGDSLHIGADMNAEISPLPPPDEWENWNQQRDKKLANGNRSLRYIPEELDDYAGDLDDNGKWVYVTDYGYCWKPLSVSAGWSPYKNGRWTWVGNDYVWVSYEQWGWCPHHFGRWAFVADFGWCWVPPRAGSVYWSPGYVGWVHTPDYVAWVPLAPGEIYYGRGYYGPQSVNITNITINRNVVINFRNVNVINAVTTVNRATFISGRKEPVKFRGNPFRERDHEIGPPAIKPTRVTAMPVLKNIPPNRRPPERVKRISVNEIKRERQIVKEEKGSAFNHARPGAEMPVRKVNEPQKMIREKKPAFPPKDQSTREQNERRGERQPAFGKPEVIKERSTPPVGPVSFPAVRPTQPSVQSAPSTRKPETQAPVETIPNNPGMQQGRERAKLREPRWQEQIPDRRSSTPRQNIPQIGPVATPGARQSPVTASPAAKPDARQLKAPSIVPGGGPGARQQSPVQTSPAAKPDARQQRAPSAVPDKQGTPMNQQRGRPDAEPKKIMEHRPAHPESPKPTEGETEKKKPERANPDMSR
jgi:hypothetical protein